MAHGTDGHGTHGGVRGYIVIALILGVITYIEFYIVEYPIEWLGSNATLWILMILSIAKFIMVILYFMHLKGDDAAYSGFFGSGMFIALGTFVVFTLLMTAPHSISFFRAATAPGATPDAHAAPAHGDDHGLDDSVMALIQSEGYSRELVQVMEHGRPKDQRLVVAPPEAPAGGFSLAAAGSGAGEGVADDAGAGEPDEIDAEAPAAGAPPIEDAADDRPETVAEEGAWDPENGEQVWSSNCVSCHQAQGQGIPGAFPPIAGHAAKLVSAEGGRSYLIDVLLFGLQGEIEVDGQTYNGVMPAWDHLDDAQIADVANFAVQLGADEALPDGFGPVAPEEVADRRAASLSPQDVHERREALELP